MLVHVGYPKTGTTWLQRNLFGDAERGFCSPWGVRAGFAIDQFVRPSAFAFDAVATARRFTDGIEVARAAGLVPVLSEETLIGDPTSGRYWGKRVADQIHATLPGARILITVREQDSLIHSAYREYVLSGGHWSIQRFLGDVPAAPGFGGVLELSELEFDSAVVYYAKLFGRDHVHVACIESLASDPTGYVRAIQGFVGLTPTESSVERVPSHAGERGIALRLRRFGNRYVPCCDPMQGTRPLSWRCLDLGCRVATRLSPRRLQECVEARQRAAIRAFVGEHFSASNRRLAELLPDGTLPDVYRR